MKAISIDTPCEQVVPHVSLPQTVFAWLKETVSVFWQNKRNARELESLPEGVLKDIGYRVPEALTRASEHHKIYNRGLRL